MSGFRRAMTCEPPPAPLRDGLTSVSACDESVNQSGCHAPGALNRLSLLLTHRGRALSRADGVAVVHCPRRLVAIAAGVIYEERLKPGAWWHLSYLMLQGPWTEPLNEALRRRPGGVLVVDDAPVALRALLTATVESTLARPRGWTWSTTATLAHLIGELLEHATQADTTLTGRVGRMIDHEPDHVWTIADVALRLRLSPTTFVRQFTADAGMAPARWLRRRRIELARRLLEQNFRVAVVAERLGFANPYHFSRVFKAIMGFSPSQARPPGAASLLHGGLG